MSWYDVGAEARANAVQRDHWLSLTAQLEPNAYVNEG